MVMPRNLAEGLDRRCGTPNNDEIHSHSLPGSVTPPAWLAALPSAAGTAPC